jgi:hypothetical protein
MLRTIEATVDENGRVFLNEEISLKGPVRALVTILEEDLSGAAQQNEPAILAESSLAEGWSGREADEHWDHLKDMPDLDEASK